MFIKILISTAFPTSYTKIQCTSLHQVFSLLKTTSISFIAAVYYNEHSNTAWVNFLHIQHYIDPSVSQLQLMTIGLHETEKHAKVNWFNCPNIKLLLDTSYAH